MKPAEGGRICGGCNKLIVDFTKSNWREIEEVQAANNNAVCGMYTDKQLQHWGQQPPANSCSKIAASLALFASLASAMPANAQDSVRTIIRGHVFSVDDGKPYGTAIITLEGTGYRVISDTSGYYEFDITNLSVGMDSPVISYSGLATFDNKLEVGSKRGDIVHNVYLKTDIKSLQAVAFYVRKPRIKDKLKHKLKRKKK